LNGAVAALVAISLVACTSVAEFRATVPATSSPAPGDCLYASSLTAGYVFTCRSTFGDVGAQAYGPWTDRQAGTWDLTAKSA